MENLWRNSHSKVLVQFIVYVPTNRGLKFVRERGLSKLAQSGFEGFQMVEERGEDIPEIIQKQLWNYRLTIFGITGQDLLSEFVISKNLTLSELFLGDLQLFRVGPYEASVYGLPTLCVIGRKGTEPGVLRELYRGMSFAQFADEKPFIPEMAGNRVAIPKRYQNLIEEQLGYKFPRNQFPELVCLDRKVDNELAKDKTLDFAIDIVVSGRTVQQLGLGLKGRLYMSDGVLIGNRIAQQKWEEKGMYPTLNPFLYWLNTGRKPRQYYGERYPGIH